MNPKNKPYIDKLTELGVLEQFRHNCDEYGMPYEERIEIPAVNYIKFVRTAFAGRYTKEGERFWDIVALGRKP